MEKINWLASIWICDDLHETAKDIAGAYASPSHENQDDPRSHEWFQKSLEWTIYERDGIANLKADTEAEAEAECERLRQEYRNVIAIEKELRSRINKAKG